LPDIFAGSDILRFTLRICADRLRIWLRVDKARHSSSSDTVDTDPNKEKDQNAQNRFCEVGTESTPKVVINARIKPVACAGTRIYIINFPVETVQIESSIDLYSENIDALAIPSRPEYRSIRRLLMGI
jgi:hypothetical protein